MATAKKTKPAAKTAARSSFDRFARLGAVQGQTRSLPGFRPTDLILPCDKKHPGYATHDPWRYSRENPEMQRELRSILASDGKLWQDPAGSTLVGRGDEVYIKEGGRRCMAFRYINQDRRKAREAELVVHVNVTFNEGIDSFMRAHDVANLYRAADDPVTVAKKLRQRLLGDDAQGIEPIAIEQACEMFGVDEKYAARVLNERTGLLALSPRWQEAVAQGRVAELAALTAATLTKGEPDKDGARHAAQDDLLDKLEQAGQLAKATPGVLRALARDGAVPAKVEKPKALTAKEKVALGRILALLTPNWCADVGELSAEEVATLKGKLPVPAGGGA